MTPEVIRKYLTTHAPELEVVGLTDAHTTDYISREWKVLPVHVTKTLTLRGGDDAMSVVTCGSLAARQPQRQGAAWRQRSDDAVI